MRKGVRQRDKYYFPNRLTRQLDRMADYPVTIVEAPSGFGKTTAVREYLKEKRSEGVRECWYTCLGESVQIAWERTCSLAARLNSKAANELKSFGAPSLDNVFQMMSYLNNMTLSAPVYVVIDNYQFVTDDDTNELLHAVSMHENPNLHAVFITQQIKACKKPPIHNDNILIIDAPSFFFDRDSTDQLLRLNGLRLSETELEQVFRATEGWVSAIRLQTIHRKETGAFGFNSNTEQLVEAAIWNRLEDEEKDFLLSISVFDAFTTAQAAVMLGRNSIPEKFETLLKSNDFIRYRPESHSYCIHSILRDYLNNRFYHFCTEEYRTQTFRKAGSSCAAISENYPAAEFYYKIRDFDAILSLPFTIECLDKQKGKSQFEFVVHIADECPDETWCKYPYAMLAFGYYALMIGQQKTHQKLCALLQRIIQDGMGFDEEALRKIEGEFTLLTIVACFNDYSKVTEGLAKAYQLLEGPSQLVNPNVQWLFATPSVLDIFWREPGTLEETMSQMDDNSHLYGLLTNNQGAGHSLVMRAEAMLHRGDTDEAEILCHEARYLASQYGQTGMCVCADFVLAKTAILKGDTKTYFEAVENMQRYSKESGNPYIISNVDYCMSLLGIYLRIDEYIAPWLYNMRKIKDVLYAPIVPFAQVIHLTLLLKQKRYHEFYGLCFQVLEEPGYIDGNIKYVIPRFYILLLLAFAEHKNGRQKEAEIYLKKAFDMAFPDQVFLPFAYIYEFGGDLSKTLTSLFDDIRSRSAPYTGRYIRRCEGITTSTDGPLPFAFANADSLKALCKRQQDGATIIKKAILQRQSPLTPREREVAALAKGRMTVREIADELFIAPSTVKTILSNVYMKLEIHSKSELAAMDF